MDLPKVLIQDEVKRALLEDLGRAGDLSTQATIDPEKIATALFVARDAGVVSGLPHASLAFETIDSELLFDQKISDGDQVSPGYHYCIGVGSGQINFVGGTDCIKFHVPPVRDLDTDCAIFGSDCPYRRADVLHTKNNPWIEGLTEICRPPWWRFEPSIWIGRCDPDQR